MHWFLKLAVISAGLVLAVSILFLSPKILPEKKISNSEVKGILFRNQVWSGTIRVTGDVLILFDTTVTIKPGTTILVANSGDKTNLDYLPWHQKNGINTGSLDHGVKKGEPFWDEKQKIHLSFHRLVAVGTKEQPIVIKSTPDSTSPYDFNQIRVDSGVLAYVQAANYRRMEIGSDVSIRDSQFDRVGECAVCIEDGSPVIINNRFGTSLHEGIWVMEASPRITDNLFINLSGAGIRLDPKGLGTPIISHNKFEMPKNPAIDILSGDEDHPGVVSFNEFSGGSVIKLTCDSKLKISENNLLGLINFSGGGCVSSYVFGPNYWGSIDTKLILSERVTGREQNYQVLIPTPLKSPPVSVGIR